MAWAAVKIYLMGSQTKLILSVCLLASWSIRATIYVGPLEKTRFIEFFKNETRIVNAASQQGVDEGRLNMVDEATGAIFTGW